MTKNDRRPSNEPTKSNESIEPAVGRSVFAASKFFAILQIVGLFPLCWLTMQAAHEAGHCLTATITGGEIERVVLKPLEFSRTDLSKNPRPRIVLWGGAIGGVLIPLLFYGFWRLFQFPGSYFARFWAGFCLIANGAYFGGDFSQRGPTDGGALIELGESRILLIFLGITAIAAGLSLWNRQGRFFGLGTSANRVEFRSVAAVWTVLIFVVLSEIFIAK